MSKNVSFIQGSKENYNPSEMAGGVFFSKDTKEILLNGESYGNSVKADEEDITLKEGNLKLKDRSYDKANFSGMGRKILRKNIVDSVNTLTQSMMQATNTIYIIQYDFDLAGDKIDIPANCVLEFDGGSLSNGRINGLNTRIEAGLVKIFNDNITYTGTWDVKEVYPEWFGIIGNNETDNSQAFQKMVDSMISHRYVFSSNGTYLFGSTIILKGDIEIFVPENSVIFKYTGNGSFVQLGTSSSECRIILTGGTYEGNNAIDIFHVVKLAKSQFYKVVACHAQTIYNTNHSDFLYQIHCTFTKCFFVGAVKNGVDLRKIKGWSTVSSFYDCVFNTNGTNLPDDSMDGNGLILDTTTVTIIHCCFELNIRGIYMPNNCSVLGCCIYNCHFEGIRDTCISIQKKEIKNISIFGNYYANGLNNVYYIGTNKDLKNYNIFIDTLVMPLISKYRNKKFFSKRNITIEEVIDKLPSLRLPVVINYKVKSAPISGSYGFIGKGVISDDTLYSLPFMPVILKITDITILEDNTVITMNSNIQHNNLVIITKDSIFYGAGSILESFPFMFYPNVSDYDKIMPINRYYKDNVLTIPTSILNTYFPNIAIGDVVYNVNGNYTRDHSIKTIAGQTASFVIQIGSEFQNAPDSIKENMIPFFQTDYKGLVFEYFNAASI